MFRKLFSTKRDKRKETQPRQAMTAAAPSVESNEVSLEKVEQARQLLKKATHYKKNKEYEKACNSLRKAYKIGGSGLMIKERLRLPMYLQLAGKNDEGWAEIQKLISEYPDAWSQADIVSQQRVFLEKEKKYRRALDLAAWHLCKCIERDQHNIASDKQLSADIRTAQDALGSWEELGIAPPETKNDHFQKVMNERIASMSSVEGVKDSLVKLVHRLKWTDRLDELASDVSNYLRTKERYDLSELQKILGQYDKHT